MKKPIMVLALLLGTILVQAKDIKTLIVTTQPEMHCQNCEQRIKGNLRFEKGVKGIETNLKTKTVTVTYDADKTTPEQLMKGFKKCGYEAKPIENKNKQTEKK